MGRGAVRRFFFGANSVRGFVPHHHQMVSETLRRLYILKGGPGVGKSTFIRAIAAELINRGFSAEYYHCSSDPASLDGCLWPEIGVAVVDGTAPHVIDPRYPGAIDEIINIGEYWDRTILIRKRQDIVRQTRMIGDTFRRAYAHIKVSGQALAMLIDIYRRAAKPGSVEQIATEVIGQLTTGGVRHRVLAISAISPDGPVSFLDGLIREQQDCLLLAGPVGSVAPVMERIMKDLHCTQPNCEEFVCGLDPSRIDHLCNNRFGVFTVTPPHYQGKIEEWTVMEAQQWLNRVTVDQYAADIAAAETVHWSAMSQATALLSEARQLHRQLEDVYIGAMDFRLLDRCRQRVMRQVLRMARGNDI